MALADDPPDYLLSPGTLLGRYRIQRPLGEGGMAIVYEAVHVDLEKTVAIKVLRPEALQSADTRRRFLREARTAANLRHPNVAEVFDVGEEDATLFLVMERMEGETLLDLLNREGPISPESAADLLLPVCGALATAHEIGVVHRDVKPENIFLARTRHGGLQPKLIDFGISLAPAWEGGRFTANSSLLGTPNYMAPEQAREGGRVDARSDQYAVAVVLYECVAGRRPFEHDQLYPLLHAIVQGEPPPSLRSLRPSIPAAFEAVVLRAMDRDPAARFPDVQALGRALLPFASAAVRGVWEPVFVGDAPPPVEVMSGRQSTLEATAFPSAPRRRSAAFAAGLALAALTVALVAVRGRHPAPTPTAPRPAAAAAAASPAAPALAVVAPIAPPPAPAVVPAAPPSVRSATTHRPSRDPRPPRATRPPRVPRPSQPPTRDPPRGDDVLGPNGSPIVE